MNIVLDLDHIRRVTGVNKQGPYDFISILAKTADGKSAELTLTPAKYDGIAGSIGILDKISFPNATVEPRKDGSVDNNGNPRLIANVDWADADIKRSPFKSTMPTLETLKRLAAERTQAKAQVIEDPVGEGSIL